MNLIMHALIEDWLVCVYERCAGVDRYNALCDIHFAINATSDGIYNSHRLLFCLCSFKRMKKRTKCDANRGNSTSDFIRNA